MKNLDLNNLNLETLDSTMNANPDMFVNQNGITFSKRVQEVLGYPAQVLCQLDPQNRVLAIRACRCDERRAFKFSKPKEEQRITVTITNKNLLEPVRRCMEGIWVPGKRYKVTGFWVADSKTMCFALAEGVRADYHVHASEADGE